MTTIILLCLAILPTKVQGNIQDYVAKREALVVFRHGHESSARSAINKADFIIVRKDPRRDIFVVRWGSWNKAKLETKLKELGESKFVQLIEPHIESRKL